MRGPPSRLQTARLSAALAAAPAPAQTGGPVQPSFARGRNPDFDLGRRGGTLPPESGGPPSLLTDMPVPSILEQIARGDQHAVQRCIDEYGGLVWRLATRYLGDSRSETDDAVQEIFIALWLSAGRFDPARGSEAAFVATVAHRRLTDAQRRRLSRREIPADAALQPPARLAERPSDLGRDPAMRAATEAFDRLPQDERHALWMVVWGGLSHSQIAAATGSPLGTVKTRLRRALRRMYESVHALDGVDIEREGKP